MKKNILIFGVFAFLILIMTFPLALKINTYIIPGFFSTDEPFGSLWDNWRIRHSFENSLSLRDTSLIAYPFGIDFLASGCFSYLWIGLSYFFSLLTTPVLAWNLQIILNIYFTLLFTYLLVFLLTQSKLAAFFSGLIFWFLPLPIYTRLATSGTEL